MPGLGVTNDRTSAAKGKEYHHNDNQDRLEEGLPGRRLLFVPRDDAPDIAFGPIDQARGKAHPEIPRMHDSIRALDLYPPVLEHSGGELMRSHRKLRGLEAFGQDKAIRSVRDLDPEIFQPWSIEEIGGKIAAQRVGDQEFDDYGRFGVADRREGPADPRLAHYILAETQRLAPGVGHRDIGYGHVADEFKPLRLRGVEDMIGNAHRHANIVTPAGVLLELEGHDIRRDRAWRFKDILKEHLPSSVTPAP